MCQIPQCGVAEVCSTKCHLVFVILMLINYYCFCGHYTGQPALASTPSQELEDFAGAKFYCPHALADGN